MEKKLIGLKEKTAGKELTEHLSKVTTLDSFTPAELADEMLAKDFDRHMTNWIREGSNVFTGDFFVVLNLKRERSLSTYFCNKECGNDECPGCQMIQPIHTIPEVRQTCPDPFYDQSVWHYHRNEERLEYLWTVPDIGTTKLFKDDPLNCPADEVQLRGFVLDYCDGTLQKRANKLNEVTVRSRDGRTRKHVS